MGIFDRNGTTIARNKRIEEFIGQPPRPDLLKAILERNEGTIQNISREGARIYTIFTRSPLSGWTFTLGVPVKEIEATARSAVRFTALGAFAVLLCTLIVAYFFVTRLTRAISKAAQSAVALGSGVVPETHSSGIKEVDALQHALCETGQALQNAMAEREKLLSSEKSARNYAELQNKAKDQFLAMLGHELRNPLAPIAAAAELLQIIEPDAQRVRQSSEIIARQANHLSMLVDDLLDVSRVSRGLVKLDMHNLDLKGVIAVAREQIQPIVEQRRHHVDIHLPDEPVFVHGDRKRLVQILSNLLSNAVKYTQEGGHIVLSVHLQERQAVIEVADNGIGMTPELISHVFELFSQGERSSDRSQGGLGLGLALAKSLVELHGGTIKAESNGVGHGSRFTILLPRLTSHSVAVSAKPVQFKPEAEHPAQPMALRILVVDDNRDAANMLANFLRANGHQVMVEYGSKRALERAGIELPDVCLLDIGLPDMDGLELARRLRSQPSTSKIKLIAVTGYGQSTDCEQAITAGFNRHLVKPINLEKLLTILANIKTN